MEGVLFPNFQRWFIALFENPVPAGTTFMSHALWTIGLIVALLLVIDISALLRGIFHARWSPIISNRIWTDLSDYVHSQSISFWTGRMAGKVHTQILYVTKGFDAIIDFWRIVCLFAIIVVNMGLIFSINTYVAIMFGIVFIFRAAYSWAMIKPMNKSAKNYSSANSEVSGKSVDSISNFSVVKLFAGVSRERAYLEPSRQKAVRAHKHKYYIQRWFWGFPMVVWDICYGITLLLCVWLYTNNKITVAEIVFTNSVFFTVMGTIGQIVNQIPNITDTLGSASRAYEELVVPIDVVDAPNAPALRVTCGEIEFRNVSFKYKRKWVLRNFNLKIKCGERVGLVGPSGAGKTTLVNLLMRFYDPSEGEILLNGKNIKEYNLQKYRALFATAFQDFQIFSLSQEHLYLLHFL